MAKSQKASNIYYLEQLMSQYFEAAYRQPRRIATLPDPNNMFKMRPTDPDNKAPTAVQVECPYFRFHIPQLGSLRNAPAPLALTQQHFYLFSCQAYQPTLPSVILANCYYFGWTRERLLRQPAALEKGEPDRRYCSPCQEWYEAYFEHIESKGHLMRIRHNPINKEILELEKQFARTHKK